MQPTAEAPAATVEVVVVIVVVVEEVVVAEAPAATVDTTVIDCGRWLSLHPLLAARAVRGHLLYIQYQHRHSKT